MSTLSGKDLLELLDFVSPDREQDPDQLECEVTLFHRASAFTSTDGEDHPAGLYAYLTEYPEEGIFGPIGSSAIRPASSEGERKLFGLVESDVVRMWARLGAKVSPDWGR